MTVQESIYIPHFTHAHKMDNVKAVSGVMWLSTFKGGMSRYTSASLDWNQCPCSSSYIRIYMYMYLCKIHYLDEIRGFLLLALVSVNGSS